jgi:hypothetical protein
MNEPPKVETDQLKTAFLRALIHSQSGVATYRDAIAKLGGNGFGWNPLRQSIAVLHAGRLEAAGIVKEIRTSVPADVPLSGPRISFRRFKLLNRAAAERELSKLTEPKKNPRTVAPVAGERLTVTHSKRRKKSDATN